jgi:RNA polymerase sigma factor (sigma-70 family)
MSQPRRADENQRLLLEYQQGNRDAAESLIATNKGLVWKWARYYLSPTGYPEADDLYAEGVTGLLYAAARFNPAFGCEFSTYASYWIRERITRAIQTSARLIRIPSALLGHDGPLPAVIASGTPLT